MHNWRFISQATRVRHFERSATLLPSSPTLRKIPRSPRLAHNLLLCRLRQSKHRKELRISHDDRYRYSFEKKKTKTPHYLPFPQNLSYFIFQTFPGLENWFTSFKTFSRIQGCLRLENLDVYLEIRIMDLQSNAKTDFTSEKSVLKVDFNHEIQIRLFGKSEKTDLQNCLVNSGLFSAITMSARARPLFSVEIRFQISQSIENPKPGFQNLNPDFLIECTQL